MKKAKIITILITLTIILLFFINPIIVKATINPDDYSPDPVDPGSMGSISTIAKAIINAISVIGTVTSIITLIIIGIKYLIGSVEEKAEYKKTMVPYLIGAIMVFAISGILTLVSNITDNTMNVKVSLHSVTLPHGGGYSED